MCTGRVDPAHILRAFSNGVDGVFIGGCRLGECNYITQGNYHALNLVLLFRKILEHIGVNPERLRIDFMSGSEGNVYVEVVNNFINKVKELGPLGKSEGIDEELLKLKMQALTQLVPYLRVMGSERLRVKLGSARQEYEDYYASEGLDKLFRELIADKLSISEIMLLLRERPLSSGEMSETLGLTPSEISRYLHTSARHGLVRYVDNRWRLALA